jgi:class 3 adenylate cyclase
MERPFPAYKGDEPYIFVSYAHEDDDTVYPEIQWLNDQGFNIWWDEGISGGTKWMDEIAHAINDSHLLVLFLSPNVAKSNHCRKEIHYAIDQDKPIVVVEIQATELTGGLKLTLGDIQAIRQPTLSRNEYESKLDDAIQRHIHHITRVIKDQTLVYSDLRAFGRFRRDATLSNLEDLLIQYDNLAQTAASNYGGVVRSVAGDSCLLSFPETDSALQAVQYLVTQWQSYIDERSIPCPMALGINRGTMNIFRSFIYGTAIDITANLSDLAKGLPDSEKKTTTLVTNRIVTNASDSWLFEATQSNDFFKEDENQAMHRDYVEFHKLGLFRLALK